MFQYRLRTLLIVTTIIAVWLGWWSYTARRQREALRRKAARRRLANRILVIADGRLVADHGQLSAQQISELLIGFEVGAA